MKLAPRWVEAFGRELGHQDQLRPLDTERADDMARDRSWCEWKSGVRAEPVSKSLVPLHSKGAALEAERFEAAVKKKPHMSPEGRARVSEAARNRVLSEATRERMRESAKKRWAKRYGEQHLPAEVAESLRETPCDDSLDLDF